MLPPANKNVGVHVKVMYQSCSMMPGGHTWDTYLAPEAGTRFEDGTIRWRFTFPAFPPRNGAVGTQGVVVTGTACAPQTKGVAVASALPARATIYYRN